MKGTKVAGQCGVGLGCGRLGRETSAASRRGASGVGDAQRRRPLSRRNLARVASSSSGHGRGEGSRGSGAGGDARPSFLSGGLSAALAALLALDISGATPAFAVDSASRQDVSVVEVSTSKVDGDIKEPASIIKDCRTDAPGVKKVYWISSRSVGQSPTLYAVDAEGKIIGSEFQVQTKNVGQEEIVFVHRARKNRMEDFIVLADTSNKFKNRDSLKFYEIAPPVPSGAEAGDGLSIEVERQIDFAFPPAASSDGGKGGKGVPTSTSYQIPIGPSSSPGSLNLQYPQEDYDTAAIIVVDDTLWVFSKRSLGSSTALYRLPLDTISPYARQDDSGQVYKLDFVQEFSSGAPACGADVSSDGTRLAVMTRETVFLFDLTTEAAKADPIVSLIGRVPIPKTAGAPVGLTWDDARTMLILTDQSELTRVKLSS